MNASVRVIIADDHLLIRRGTRDILDRSPDITVVGEAVDGDEVVRLAKELQPDVILMDIRMPGLNGVLATREISARWPQIRVVILTVHDEEALVMEAISAGAVGYLLKDVRDRELIQAVLTVRDGGAILDPAVTLKVVRQAAHRESDRSQTTSGRLSPRQLDVLRLVSEGCSNRKIGEQLGVSARTVEVHLRNIFERLGASSRTEAVVLALRRGLLRFSDPESSSQG